MSSGQKKEFRLVPYEDVVVNRIDGKKRILFSLLRVRNNWLKSMVFAEGVEFDSLGYRLFHGPAVVALAQSNEQGQINTLEIVRRVHRNMSAIGGVAITNLLVTRNDITGEYRVTVYVLATMQYKGLRPILLIEKENVFAGL